MPTAASALDDTLIALADPVRRSIVELLKVRPRRAGELATLLELNAPVMSKHLKILRGSSLVEEERPPDDARARVYRLRPERLEELKDWLNDVGAFWSDQLASFKAAAETAAKRAPARDVPPSDSRKGRRPRKSKSGKRR
jgi:DNA-binding transcriptional ArsR family regulator